jgi:hypothetical protein
VGLDPAHQHVPAYQKDDEMTKETGGPAFPYLETGDCGQREGMTLRDYFAAKAVPGLVVAGRFKAGMDQKPESTQYAESAYKIADAMLRARK